MTLKETAKLSIPSVFIASLCCLVPIIIVLFGFGSLSFAIGLTDLLDTQYRWLFILAGSVFMFIAVIRYFRSNGICTLDDIKRNRTKAINELLIILFISIILYIVFFYGILGFIGRQLHLWE